MRPYRDERLVRTFFNHLESLCLVKLGKRFQDMISKLRINKTIFRLNCSQEIYILIVDYRKVYNLNSKICIHTNYESFPWASEHLLQRPPADSPIKDLSRLLLKIWVNKESHQTLNDHPLKSLRFDFLLLWTWFISIDFL